MSGVGCVGSITIERQTIGCYTLARITFKQSENNKSDKTTTACNLLDSKSEPAHENEKVPLALLPLRESGDQQAERSHTTTTLGGAQTSFLSLCTVPVIVKNGDHKVKVNALLDEASTETYINCDIAGELRLERILWKVTVNFLNGQTKTFETMPVVVEVESLDGTVKKTVSAFTTEKVTGTLEASIGKGVLTIGLT